MVLYKLLRLINCYIPSWISNAKLVIFCVMTIMGLETEREKERVYVRENLFTADIDWIHMYVRASTSFKPSYLTFIIYTAALATSPHSFSKVELTLGVDDSDALWFWGKTSTDIPALAVVNMYISFEESWSLDVVRHKAECMHILSRFLRIL